MIVIGIHPWWFYICTRWKWSKYRCVNGSRIGSYMGDIAGYRLQFQHGKSSRQMMVCHVRFPGCQRQGISQRYPNQLWHLRVLGIWMMNHVGYATKPCFLSIKNLYFFVGDFPQLWSLLHFSISNPTRDQPQPSIIKSTGNLFSECRTWHSLIPGKWDMGNTDRPRVSPRQLMGQHGWADLAGLIWVIRWNWWFSCFISWFFLMIFNDSKMKNPVLRS